MDQGSELETTIARFYVDVRPLTPRQRTSHVDLPLLSTLPPDLQQSIKNYLRPSDRLMSLSSSLLKYYFIHKSAHIPWDQVAISRTPKPHRRPYWSPPLEWPGEGGLEFNVTHQNGFVGLVGCKTPTVQDPNYDSPVNGRFNSTSLSEATPRQVSIGVDVACVREEGRSPSDVDTQAKLDEWLDIFGEMFSDKCLDDIRHAPVPGASSEAQTMQARLRRFYAFWALKEAYIKMVGEGLLADWLRKLEFEEVSVPVPATKHDWDDDGFSWAFRHEEEMKWPPADKSIKDIRAVLHGKEVADVQLELVAYEEDFLLTTAMRGVKKTGVVNWIKLDIDKDIKPCAEGKCNCRMEKAVELVHNTARRGSATTSGDDQSYLAVEAED